MKRIFLYISCFFIVFGAFAENPGEKTFLILFDKSELKDLRSSPQYIEMSLMNIFKTKAYSGNSDAAILIKVPYENLDECQIGYLFVRVNNKTVLPLQDVALKIIDLDQTKNTYQYLLASLEDKNNRSKKNAKPLKTAPSP
ncbi:hypothetical protein BC751_1909 [Cecembia calidifontis]|jgi:hypothetical protein|uniref:Uncharacterized protein n=2 Tax=Cecembia calidifontis TaxID=1187080 RepID=A0A4Q7P9T2_9BACT|nr:hypothetical protein BC751_1909 [Cecembia calidifontis]